MSGKCSADGQKPCDHGKFPDAPVHCSITSCPNSIYRCGVHRKGLR